jgi:NADPH-dependent 2,4-dienoyl-CoA reductase/sulfur reductase-like enzyme/rhodanese-related sulfurtransferase
MNDRQIVIVGGVAGGMSCATRLRRLDEEAAIIVVERSAHVSYANCGLPYFVGGVIEDEDDLLLMTPERLHERFRLDVRVRTEVVDIDTVRRTVTVRPSDGYGGTMEIVYDALVLSPGAAPVRPALPGFDRVAVLRTVEDAEHLADQAREGPRSAVVVGAGFVGLETAENLASRGIRTTVVEGAPQLLTPLDPELAVLVEAELLANGVLVETGVDVAEVNDAGVVLADGRVVPGDLVVAAIGVRPDVRLAELAGLALGPNGGIAVDYHGCTSEPDVYAVGDAVEKADSVGGGSSLIALANIANRQGRRVADHICGRSVRPMASVGTAIVRVFGLTAAMTGWNERRLKAAGRAYRVVHSHPMSHAGYYPGAEPMALKLLFDPEDGTILGAQAVGGMGVDKRIDVLATAMAAGLGALDLADLELAYAPPFSSAKDPVNMLGYMAENVVLGECDVIEPSGLDAAVAEGWTVLDVRTEDEHRRGAIPRSVNSPLEVLRERLAMGVLGSGPFVVYCEVGQRGHTATALLHERGIEARNLDGWYRTWRAVEAARAGDPEQVILLRDRA